MDIELDRATHDIVTRGFDLSILTDEIDIVRQRLKQRLLAIKNDWFLDQNNGLPWFGELNTKTITEPRVRAILIRQIRGTEGVEKLLNFQMGYNRGERTLLVEFEVTTVTGAAVELRVEI